MSRKHIIAIAGVTILAGLALIENLTRNVTVVPATITEIRELVPDAGPDRFQVAFEMSDGTTALLEAQQKRPTLKAGDVICVRMHQRSWASPKFVKSAQTTC